MVDYDNPKKKLIVEYYPIYICDVLSILCKILIFVEYLFPILYL